MQTHAFAQLSIVQAREQDERCHRSDQGQQHVRLGVPDITLGAKEIFRTLTKRDGGAPFDQLIARADCEHDADDQKGEHPATEPIAAAKQHLTRGQGRHEALEKVTDLVVGIALQAEHLLHLEAERHPRIGVGTAEHEHEGMHEDAHVKQGSQRIAPMRGVQDRQHDQDRCDLHEPGSTVVGLPARPRQKHEQDADAGDDEPGWW